MVDSAGGGFEGVFFGQVHDGGAVGGQVGDLVFGVDIRGGEVGGLRVEGIELGLAAGFDDAADDH